MTSDQPAIAHPTYQLPPPKTEGGLPLTEALAHRKSVRKYTDAPLGLEDISQLLWAAEGATHNSAHRTGLRTAPSAGGLYPLEIYLVCGAVDGVDVGVYHHTHETHSLTQTTPEDVRTAMADLSAHQDWMADCTCAVVITADVKRTAVKYGKRARRYVHMEVGHVAQNILLQATALGLANATVGAFKDRELKSLLHLSDNVHPYLILTIGRSPTP